MKTQLLSTLTLLCWSVGFGQVGINTTTPSATLDVTAKTQTGTTTTPEGLIVPRVDRQRAQSMTSVPTSTIIYVNDISTGTLAGTAVNIDAVGLYSYDGTVWNKLGSGGSGSNIYNTDGTLTGNRNVSLGSNNLNIAGSSSTTTFASNGNVGIGTTAPTEKLHVNGNVRINNMPTTGLGDRPVYIDNNGVLKVFTASTANRVIWGVVRPNSNGTVTVLNSGSGGWSATRTSVGTVMIDISTPFSSVPCANALQYLNSYSSSTSNTSFGAADARDNAGVDGASFNQVQIWACDSNFFRSDRVIAFTITGF